MPAARGRGKLARRIIRHWEFYAMLALPLIVLIIFSYVPMYGIQIAFKDFRASRGIWGSDWVGLKWFVKFFSAYNSQRMIINTFMLSFTSMLFSFPVPIVLALMLNQVPSRRYQRTVQTAVYAPHFISVMVLAGMLHIFLSPYGGLINQLLNMLGKESIYFLGDAKWFRPIYIISGIWQDAGWGTIIYLATLSGVNVELYEAATVDGAGKLRRIWHIDIPALLPTIVILLIMSLGSLMSVGFEKTFLLQTTLNKETSDIIATYVYEQGVLKTQYSFSTAVGLFNTLVNLALLVIVNFVAGRVSEYNLF
jgi:putative aldouronate transport system permease protein